MNITNYIKKTLILKDNKTQFTIRVNKKIYDEIRLHNGEFIINDKSYYMFSFITGYISMGEINFTLEVELTLIQTASSVRNDKLNLIFEC